MFFKIDNTHNLNEKLLKYKVISLAKSKIILYKEGASEQILNRYLLEKYNKPLKWLCLIILMNIKIMSNSAGELIAIIQNKKLNQIAELITYGNGRVHGSRILRLAISI